MKEKNSQEGQLSLNRLFDNLDANAIEQQLQEKLDAELDKTIRRNEFDFG